MMIPHRVSTSPVVRQAKTERDRRSYVVVVVVAGVVVVVVVADVVGCKLLIDVMYDRATMEMMKAIYYRPHAHVASYVIGVVMGFVMVRWNDLKLTEVQIQCFQPHKTEKGNLHSLFEPNLSDFEEDY